MPRPGECAGAREEPPSAAGGGEAGASFEELLHLLTAKHEGLRRIAEAHAAENHSLRKRLLCSESCSEGAAVASEQCSLWRRQLSGGEAAAASRTWQVQAVQDCSSCASCEVSAQPLEDAAPSQQQQEQPMLGRISAATGRPDSKIFLGQPYTSEEHMDAGKDPRVDACIQKLRDMLDVGMDRQTLTTDEIDAYLRRIGIYNDDFSIAVCEIVHRLRDRQQATVMPRSVSTFSASALRRSSIGSGSRMFSMMFKGNAVQLKAMAELLLASNVEDILGHCTADMLEVVKLLRLHAFHQDTLGILPASGALDDLERVHKETKFERRLDIFMNVVIAANAVCMGIFASDTSNEWGNAQVLDVIFTVIFLLEALFKINRFGPRTYFCGADWLWNIFDVCIVALGVGDFIMTISVVSTGNFNTSSLMVLRLLRLGRLLRVIRMSLFREMKLMLNGIVGLFKTLGCAMVILVVSTYITSALMVQIFSVKEGEPEIVHGQEMLFNDMPKAMFTVFRCLNLGDCNAANGTPIALQLSQATGWPFAIMHSILSVLMNYGLGSLITALVVDTTLVEAKKAEFKASLKDSHVKHISWSLHRLGQIFERAQSEQEDSSRTAPAMLFLSREAFQKTLRRKDVQRILDDMDIDASDRSDIFDAIDADGNGRIEIDELVAGLTRMSGKARRADTVAARLKIDSLVKRLHVTHAQLMEEHRQIHDRIDALALGGCMSGTPTADALSRTPSLPA